MSVSRQQRRAIARKAAKIFVREKLRMKGTREERKAKIDEVAARAFRECPASQFEKHVIARPKIELAPAPRIIIPEIEVQGVDAVDRHAQSENKARSLIIP